MNIILETAKGSDYRKIKRLYRKSFPPEERIPFFILKRKAKHQKAHMLAAKQNGAFVGFVYLVCHFDMAYLFFLAISPEKRGMGCGSKILKALKKQYVGKRIFLAREPLDEKADNYEQRVKRHSFYLRNGFEDLPCKIKEAGVVYDAMGIGGEISAEEYDSLISAWSGDWIRKFIDMEFIDERTGSYHR